MMQLLGKLGLMLTLFITLADGLKVDGSIDFQRYAFLTKFVFLTDSGRMRVNVSFQHPNTMDEILRQGNPIIIDGFHSEEDWVELYDKYKGLNKKGDPVVCTNFLIDIKRKSGYYIYRLEDFTRFDGTNASIFQMYDIKVEASSELYTFLALFMCDIGETYKVGYQMELTNGKGIFRKQISADHIYIYETLIFLFIAYIVILVIMGFYRKAMKKSGRYSGIVTALQVAIFLKLAVHFYQMIVMASYASTGIFKYEVFMVGEFFSITSEVVFVILILLLAFGLSIVCGRLNKILIIIIILLGFASIIISIIAVVIFILTYDEADIQYYYTNDLGYIQASLYFLMFIMFLVGCIHMLIKFRKQRLFYSIFLVVCGSWIISVPVLIIISDVKMHNYLKFSLIFIIRNLIDMLAPFVYMIITFPGLLPKVILFTTPPKVVAGSTLEEAIQQEEQMNQNDIQDISEFHVVE